MTDRHDARRRLRPTRFFADHPLAYAASLAGAGLAAAVFARRASGASDRRRRALWFLLALSEVAQLAGIWRARRTASRLEPS